MDEQYSLHTPWRRNVIRRLQERNAREVDPFSALVHLQNHLQDRCHALQTENAQLKRQNDHLLSGPGGASGAGGGGGGGQVINADQAATISMLEKKLFAVQEELTELHRRKSENAQQIIDQGRQHKENLALLEEKSKSLEKAEASLKENQEVIGQLTNTVQELQYTNQLLKDEHQTLQLAWSTKERELLEARKEIAQAKKELEDAKRESEAMINQIMLLKEKEVALMNRENDLFLEQKQLEAKRVQRQLEEAAREPQRFPSLEPSGSVQVQKVGYEGLIQQSAICHMARVPTRAYLKFEAHDGEVNSIKWSPNGLVVVTGGSDRKIKSWDVSKGNATLCSTLRGCSGSVMSLDYDAAGTMLLAASYDSAIRVWSTDDLKLRHTFTGHTKQVLSAKFIEDSNKFVSASHDSTLRIWDLRAKACVGTKFAGSYCNDVICVDTNIISGHFDCSLKFWDARSGNTPTQQIKLGGKIASLDASRNGYWILACTRDDTLRLVDLRMNQEVRSFTVSGFRVGCDWTRASFSPDSEYVCVGSADGSVYIWSVGDSSKPEKVLRDGHASAVVAVAWQPSGNSLTTCDKTKHVVVWADI